MNILFDDLNNGVEKTFQSYLDDGQNEIAALEKTISLINDNLSNMSLPQQTINNASNQIIKDFKEALNQGEPPVEALNIAIDKLHQNINNKSDDINDIESNINLDFAITGDSPRLELMNEAMAKGLSVEDAVKYVNSKLNQDGDEFGPPTLAEFNKVNENENLHAKENQEINKIEATMDAEANNKFDNTLTDTLNIDEKNIKSESNLDYKDDDLS